MSDEKLKERRLKKFGELPVEKMSSTTRWYFKKWGHRLKEIRTWEKDKKAREKAYAKKKRDK